MAWHVRCWQGVCFGSQTIFARLGASATLGQYLQGCHLDRDDGWQGMHVQCAESCTFDDVVAFFLGPFLASSTVHVRLFLYIGSTLEQLSIPTSCSLLWHRRIICEERCLSGIMVCVRPLVTELDGLLSLLLPSYVVLVHARLGLI